MKLEPDYLGPVRIIDGPHAGKLGFVDDYDDEGRAPLAVVYLEGQEGSGSV